MDLKVLKDAGVLDSPELQRFKAKVLAGEQAGPCVECLMGMRLLESVSASWFDKTKRNTHTHTDTKQN